MSAIFQHKGSTNQSLKLRGHCVPMKRGQYGHVRNGVEQCPLASGLLSK
jgi:hypothetical protein